jgi:hypothetical protein
MIPIQTRCLFLATILPLAAIFPSTSSARERTAPSDLGYLTIEHTSVAWPAPESLLSELRSRDDQKRIKALLLLGVPEAAPKASFATPQEVELRYAPLGLDGTQQAIIGAFMPEGKMLYGAVAAQTGGRWRRIVSFSCWCKYEYGNPLATFLQTRSTPDGKDELLLRASGGGTGVYTQNEAHFRFYHGELRLVFSLIRRSWNCDPTSPGPFACNVQWRWFYISSRGSAQVGVLVQTRFKTLRTDPDAEYYVLPELELAHAKTFRCSFYKWDTKKFEYLGPPTPIPCNPNKLK